MDPCFFFCFSFRLSVVVARMCRVSGGVLGIPCSSVIGLGWQPLAVDESGTQCWESCCLEPSCSAVWSLGGYCVLLKCVRPNGCEISSLPLTHINSLGILQLLDKNKSKKARVSRQTWVSDSDGGPGHKPSKHVCVVNVFLLYNVHSIEFYFLAQKRMILSACACYGFKVVVVFIFGLKPRMNLRL